MSMNSTTPGPLLPHRANAPASESGEQALKEEFAWAYWGEQWPTVHLIIQDARENNTPCETRSMTHFCLRFREVDERTRPALVARKFKDRSQSFSEFGARRDAPVVEKDDSWLFANHMLMNGHHVDSRLAQSL
jgi:hypothetical protein